MFVRIVGSVVNPSPSQKPADASGMTPGQPIFAEQAAAGRVAVPLLSFVLRGSAKEQPFVDVERVSTLSNPQTMSRPSPLAPAGDLQALRMPDTRVHAATDPAAKHAGDQPPKTPVSLPLVILEATTPKARSSAEPNMLSQQSLGWAGQLAMGLEQASQLGAKNLATQPSLQRVQIAISQTDDDVSESSARRPIQTPVQRIASESVSLHPAQAALLLAQHQARFVLPMFSARQLRRGGVAGSESGTEHETSRTESSSDLFGEHALTIGHEPPLEGSLSENHSRNWFDLLKRHQRRSQHRLSRVTRFG